MTNGNDNVATLLLAAGASSSVLGTKSLTLPNDAKTKKMSVIYSQLGSYRDNLTLASRYFVYSFFTAEKRQVDELWTDYVARNSRERLEKWLSLSDLTFLPEIPLPKLLPFRPYIQKEWESNKEFEERVNILEQERQVIIQSSQNKYQLDVEERNKKIVSLQMLQKQRTITLAAYRKAFALFTMEELFPKVTFRNATFDQNTEKLYLNNVGIAGEDLGRFVMANTDQDFRNTILKNSDNIDIVIEPFADDMGEFGIKAVKVSYHGKTQTALPITGSAGTQAPLVAIIDTGRTIVLPQGQNLDFSNFYSAGNKIYKDGSIVRIGPDDNLELRISKLPRAAPNKRKWAFVVGAESYLNTDPIAYARRSAESFAYATNFIFGVPENQVITLYDEKATSGNIKGKLRKLLDKGLKEGDTLYFYYNGHGVPNPQQANAPYMLATDMNLDYINEEPFYDLRNIYTMLSESPAKSVIAFMDSCFTGKTDGRSIYKGKAAPQLPPLKIDIAKQGNLAVITAGTATQFSSAWPQKGYRLLPTILLRLWPLAVLETSKSCIK